jgi:hypothetical protein
MLAWYVEGPPESEDLLGDDICMYSEFGELRNWVAQVAPDDVARVFIDVPAWDGELPAGRVAAVRDCLAALIELADEVEPWMHAALTRMLRVCSQALAVGRGIIIE